MTMVNHMDAADIVASQMTEADHLEQVKAVALTCGWLT